MSSVLTVALAILTFFVMVLVLILCIKIAEWINVKHLGIADNYGNSFWLFLINKQTRK